MKFPTLSFVLVLAFVVSAGCAPAARPPRDEPRDEPDEEEPPPPSFAFVPVSEARDVSPDGRTVLLEELGYGRLFFYDTIAGTLAERPDAKMPFVERNQALGVSNAKHIAAEVGDPVSARVWSDADGAWTDLGSPFAAGCVDPDTQSTTDIAGAWDVSADGSVVVGLAYDACTPNAYRWDEGTFTVLEPLGTPLAGSDRTTPVNRASVVSDDGRVAAGWAENGPVDRSPAIWREDGTGFMLDPDDQDRPGEILSLTADGRAFAGVWANEGFVYTEEDGVTMIGRFRESLPFEGVFPNAVAQDGALVFGSNAYRAFVWTPVGGLRELAPVLTEAGLTVPEGWQLANVVGVSSDGTVIAGTAFDPITFAQQAFVARLPVSAYGE